MLAFGKGFGYGAHDLGSDDLIEGFEILSEDLLLSERPRPHDLLVLPFPDLEELKELLLFEGLFRQSLRECEDLLCDLADLIRSKARRIHDLVGIPVLVAILLYLRFQYERVGDLQDPLRIHDRFGPILQGMVVSDSCAGAEREHIILYLIDLILDSREESLHEIHGCLLARIDQHQEPFIPSVIIRKQPAGTERGHLFPQHGSEFEDRFGSRLVPVGLIRGLEIVHVEDDDRQLLALAQCEVLEGLRQLPIESVSCQCLRLRIDFLFKLPETVDRLDHHVLVLHDALCEFRHVREEMDILLHEHLLCLVIEVLKLRNLLDCRGHLQDDVIEHFVLEVDALGDVLQS